MQKRYRAWLGAWIVLLLATAACEGETPAEATRITVMVAGDPEEIDAYRAVVAGFNDSQAAVEAELIPFAERDDLILRLSTSIAGGQPPDLFLMNYRFYGQYAARGALEPVGSVPRPTRMPSPRPTSSRPR